MGSGDHRALPFFRARVSPSERRPLPRGTPAGAPAPSRAPRLLYGQFGHVYGERMSKCIAQVTLDRDGGMPEDAVVNTFHFEDDSGFSTDAGIEVNGDGLMNRLENFYNQAGALWLSDKLAGTGTIKLYDWSDALPRIPIKQRTFSHGTGPGALPSEVALCISFKAAAEAGALVGRRRGRIFFGPLAYQATQQEGAGSDVRPTQARIDALLAEFRTMALGGSGAFRLAIYSPTTKAAGGTDDAAWTDAATIWIDNAYDIVRKRGAKATVRRQTPIGALAVTAG